jgi:hypothetical protein
VIILEVVLIITTTTTTTTTVLGYMAPETWKDREYKWDISTMGKYSE